MQLIQMYRYDIDIADEIYAGYRKRSSDDDDLLTKLRSFAIIDFQSVQRAVDQAGLRTPQSMRMLEAHGGSDKNRYLFTDMIDGKRIWTPVEEWIDKHDGHYDVMYVCVCNPCQYVLNPRKSIVVYPAAKLSGREVFLQAEGNGNNILNITPQKMA